MKTIICNSFSELYHIMSILMIYYPINIQHKYKLIKLDNPSLEEFPESSFAIEIPDPDFNSEKYEAISLLQALKGCE